MAQTVKVEIPISATDKTSSGVNSAKRNLSSLENALDKMQKAFDKMSGKHNIDVDVNNNASDKMADIEDSVNRVDKSTATVSAEMEDNVTQAVQNVRDELAATNGQEAATEVSTEDNATPVIDDIKDELAALNGQHAAVDVSVNDNASDSLKHIQDSVDEMQSSVASGAKSGAKSALGTVAAITGAGFSVVGAANQFQTFEQEMANVQAISGATGEEFEALNAKAKYMGATTKFTATQSAEAMKYMAMAGWKSEEMIAGLPGIMNLAAAAGEDLGTTSDIVTDALTAFGMKASEAGRLSDALAVASSNSNTNVSMLGESFKYVGPMAGAMGYTIEDTAKALGLMANAGVKSSMSGTALRRAITALVNPQDKVQAAMDKYNISLANEDGSMKSLNEVMINLRESLRDLDAQEKSAAVSTLFGAQALSGMLAIINASDADWNKMTLAMENTTGATDRMAAVMLDTQEGALLLMQSAIEGTGIAFGERLSPYVIDFANTVAQNMPKVTDIINDVFDQIDALTSSDEWKTGDLFDKIDIAWDSLILEPFSAWASGDGLVAAGDIIRDLFSNAFKLLPGGEEAGLSSWLSAGALVFGATKVFGLAGQISEFGTAVQGLAGAGGILGELAGGFSTIAGPAVLAAAGIGAVAAAIASYNAEKVDLNLAEHFGEITLTKEQQSSLAEQILDVPFTANLKAAAVQLDSASDLVTKAEAALEANKKINWKVNSVHLEMTAEDSQSLIDNVDEFTSSLSQALLNKEYGAEEAVTGLFGSYASQELIRQMQGWFAADNAQLSGLSSAISGILQNALDQGAYDVNAEAAISILQQKMMQIVNASREAKQKAALDYLTLTSSGAALDPESWRGVVAEMDMQMESIKADVALIDFLYYSGCRVSEVASIDIEDIDIEQKSVTVLGKGNKERTIYLTDIAIMHLGKYIGTRSSGALFMGKGTARMTKGGIEAAVKRIGEQAGVSNVHCHRFRRTLASNLIQKGVNILTVAQILGHADLRTTQEYCYIGATDVQTAYRTAFAA